MGLTVEYRPDKRHKLWASENGMVRGLDGGHGKAQEHGDNC